MPNHVEGLIRIMGTKEDVNAVMEFVKDGENIISANKVIPYPEKFKKMDEEYHLRYGNWDSVTPEQKERAEADRKNGVYIKDGYNSGGYEWCCENWGTKWDFYDIGVSDVSKMHDGKFLVEYLVYTAWAPAIPVMIALSKKFPNVTIEYWFEDEGWCYPAGRATIKDGYSSEQVWEDIDAWKKMEIFEAYEDWLKWQKECEE